MRPCGKYSLNAFSQRTIVTHETINMPKSKNGINIILSFLYILPSISTILRFFKTFGFEPKKITRRGNPTYRYGSPYKNVLSKHSKVHDKSPTKKDKKIFLKFFILKFFILKFLSIVFITLHHFYCECHFMIALSPFLYKEKLP